MAFSNLPQLGLEIPRPMIQRLIKELDHEGDGYVSVEQFSGAVYAAAQEEIMRLAQASPAPAAWLTKSASMQSATDMLRDVLVAQVRDLGRISPLGLAFPRLLSPSHLVTPSHCFTRSHLLSSSSRAPRSGDPSDGPLPKMGHQSGRRRVQARVPTRHPGARAVDERS